MSPSAPERTLTTEEFYALLGDVQDALVVTDPAGVVVYMNAAAAQLPGLLDSVASERGTLRLLDDARETFDVRTLDGRAVGDADRPLVRALRGESYRDAELLVKRAGDDDFRVYVFSSNQIAGDAPLGVLTVRDETDRWRSERRHRVAFEADRAPSVIARLSDLRIVEANEGMTALTGLAMNVLQEQILTELKPLHQSKDLNVAIEGLRGGARIHRLERRMLGADGSEVHVLISAQAIEVDGQACGIFTYIDLTDLEAAQLEQTETLKRLNAILLAHAAELGILDSLARTDSLTRLPNRRSLDDRLTGEIRRAARYGSMLAVLMLDLDHFKVVNDEHGHEVGDAALLAVARILTEAGRAPDMAGRWGGRGVHDDPPPQLRAGGPHRRLAGA
ncbi:MAG: sensor domain-containing diguanylate cyclase [Trueperaceae bacterium]|nr:sensor domain-containing diguanylate cyclase [Trueperaceae bacterium]